MKLTLAFSFALALVAGVAMAAPINLPAGPYKLDAAGKCHAANGKSVRASMCAAPAPHCRTGKPCGNTCIKLTETCHKA